MSLVHLRVLHNTDYRRANSHDMTYADGDQLTEVFDHWHTADETTTAERIANWAYLAFSAPVEALEDQRRQPHGETAFLAGCLYQILGLRWLYVGDVIAIHTEQATTWLACERKGWRTIDEPFVSGGEPLTEDRIHQVLKLTRQNW